MSVIMIPGRLVNKANRYEVRINASLWKRIKETVERWKKETGKSPWWIGPSEEVKAFELDVAYRFLAGEKREWLNGEPLQLGIVLTNQATDIDAIKAIGDAIQKTGRIKNDRQFRKILVLHREGQTSAVQIVVEPYGLKK